MGSIGGPGDDQPSDRFHCLRAFLMVWRGLASRRELAVGFLHCMPFPGVMGR